MNVDALDGAVDEAIARELPSDAGAGNDLEFAKIARSLRGARPGSRRVLLTSAIAASILVAGVAGLVAVGSRGSHGHDTTWDGTKGLTARPIPVRLRFLEMAPDRQIEKGISGEAVDAEASLLFEVEAARAAFAAIARVSPDGTAELIWSQRIGEGRTQVAVGGRPAAYPLTGLHGPQRFILVASDAALDDRRVLDAGRALAPPAGIGADDPALNGLSMDVVELSVR
ncbi:MAG TPA: hypothetical protein VLT61_06475 [Anaeromyxobacteraceae bacterium]|nr:hypothetical protein [Anaeromyxobacteraceae bacterium]